MRSVTWSDRYFYMWSISTGFNVLRNGKISLIKRPLRSESCNCFYTKISYTTTSPPVLPFLSPSHPPTPPFHPTTNTFTTTYPFPTSLRQPQPSSTLSLSVNYQTRQIKLSRKKRTVHVLVTDMKNAFILEWVFSGLVLEFEVCYMIRGWRTGKGV